MGEMDFPTWYGIGSYGGLASCLLAASAIAAYALLGHRGTPRQLARAILVCLAAGCLILPPIWWDQNRLELYAPALGSSEVLVWLVWCALAGWLVPLGTLAGYAALAAPQPVAPVPALQTGSGSGIVIAALDDPARMRHPLGSGAPWGRLVPFEGQIAVQPIPLTRQLTLLGRELDNDIVVHDERTSRHHAELHWDHGHVQILDRRSMNGTLVNQQPVRGLVPLKSGDIVELGAQRYRLEILPSGPLSRAQPATSEVETAKLPGAGQDVSLRPLAPLALVAQSSTISGKSWELHEDVTMIGRDPERQICLPHESVSRQHAQIVRQRTGWYLSDLRSRNGTLLNGQPISEPHVLQPGDLVRIGEIELRCELAPAFGQPGDGAHASELAVSPLEVGHDQPTISLVPRNATPADTR